MTHHVNPHNPMTNEKGEPALPKIKAALKTADATYAAFLADSVQNPKEIQAHVATLTAVTDQFSALTDILNSGNPMQRAHVKATVRDLLQKQKAAYQSEAKSLIGELTDNPNLPVGPRMSHYLNGESGMQYLQNLSTTPDIIQHAEDLRHLATSYHVPVANDGAALKGMLASISNEAIAKESKYHLPAGAIETMLELDRSKFFSAVANAGAETGQNTNLADLLNKETFIKRLTKRIDLDTADQFHTSVSVALSKSTGRSGGGQLQ